MNITWFGMRVKDKNENPAKVKNIKDIDFKEISAILETN